MGETRCHWPFHRATAQSTVPRAGVKRAPGSKVQARPSLDVAL